MSLAKAPAEGLVIHFNLKSFQTCGFKAGLAHHLACMV